MPNSVLEISKLHYLRAVPPRGTTPILFAAEIFCSFPQRRRPMNLRPEAAPILPRQPIPAAVPDAAPTFPRPCGSPSLPYLLGGCSRRRSTSSIHGVVHPGNCSCVALPSHIPRLLVPDAGYLLHPWSRVGRMQSSPPGRGWPEGPGEGETARFRDAIRRNGAARRSAPRMKIVDSLCAA